MDKKKIIKIILAIFTVIILIFLINLGRKVYILSKYSNNYNEYSKVTNFYKKSNPEKNITTEFWRKDKKGLLKRTSANDKRMIYYGEDFNWIIINSKDENNNDTKTAVKMIKEGPSIETQTLMSESLYLDNFRDIIKLAFLSRITTEKVDNIECYKVYANKDWQVFINKNNFLIMREINGSIDTGLIEYKLNQVNDVDVTMPNLDGYTINDTTIN